MAKSLPILCGSIAGNLGGMGVLMHNAAYKKLGLNYTYVSFQPDNLEYAIKGMRSLGIKGLGVTMPFKQEVIKYLDELDETAKVIGAVNTIVNQDGKLIGYNTDWIGAIKALGKVCSLKDKKVVIIGAGGAARAIIYGLKKYTDDITIYNIEHSMGEELAQYYNVTYSGIPQEFSREVPCDILINATSVGFKSDESVLTKEQMVTNKIVLDAVFIPIETTFIKYAKELDCTAIEGYKMLIHQATYQFELYTGEKAPYDVMSQAVVEKIRGSQ